MWSQTAPDADVYDLPPTLLRYVARNQPTYPPKPPTHPAVQQYSNTRLFRIPLLAGDRGTAPLERTFPRPPLAELGIGARSIGGDPEGCLPCGAGLTRLRGRGGPRGTRESRHPAGDTKKCILVV